MSQLAEGFGSWQAADWIHPLTCSGGGGPGDHQTDLVLKEDRDDGITLVCPTCGFEQRVQNISSLAAIIAAGPPRHPLLSGGSPPEDC